MKHIFIDTNIFLHFKDIREIDWLDESSSSECKLIIPLIVLNELDTKKDGAGAESKRAKKSIKYLEEIDENEGWLIKENIHIEFITKTPDNNIFDQNALRQDKQDDNLLASMIAYKETVDIADIFICTNDAGLRMRARRFGFGRLILNEENMLPPINSEERRKINKLEDEIRQLRHKIPELVCLFKGHTNYINLTISGKIENTPQKYFEEKMKDLLLEYPQMNYEPEPRTNYNKFTGLSMSNAPSSEQIREYNAQLHGFYRNMEQYYKEEYKFLNRDTYTYRLDFIIKNKGNVPASNVTVHLNFPEGIFVILSADLKDKPKEPRPPYKPTIRAEVSRQYGTPSQIFDPSLAIDFDPLKPTIEKKHGYEVVFNDPKVKHGYINNLDSVSIIFNPEYREQNFKIEYRISADNMPSQADGILNVTFTGKQ